MPETVERWLAEVTTEPNFFFICVLGKFVAYHDVETSQWEFERAGEDSFMAFALPLLKTLAEADREDYVRCDSDRYLDLIE